PACRSAEAHRHPADRSRDTERREPAEAGTSVDRRAGRNRASRIPGPAVAFDATAARLTAAGKGESPTDGSVVAMKRGNARGAKGPCRRHSEQEAMQERDDKAHHQSAGASCEDRPSGEIRPGA